MNSANWKIGMSSCYKKSFSREVFEEYASAGIDVMEVSITDASLELPDFKELKKNAEECSVGLWSFHLPFCPFEWIDISSPDKSLRRGSIELIKEYLKYSGELEVPVAVMHPSAEPNKPEERSERIKCAADSFAELAEAASREGIRIAVEDLPRTCIGNCAVEIAQIIEADHRLGICFDTCHLLTESCTDFIKAVGSRIITLHVSDYELRNERHWLPGEGVNDWVGILTLLEECGYTGPWMYEISAKAPPSITRPGDLTCADFASNAAAILAKRAPKVIGTPNEQYCLETAYIK